MLKQGNWTYEIRVHLRTVFVALKKLSDRNQDFKIALWILIRKIRKCNWTINWRFTYSLKSPAKDRINSNLWCSVSARSRASSRSLRFKKAGSLISRVESRQGTTGTYTSDYQRGRWESPIPMDAKNARPARIHKWTRESSATNRLSQIVLLRGRFRGHNAIVFENVTHGGNFFSRTIRLTIETFHSLSYRHYFWSTHDKL